jgi:hypothetical protein
MRYGICVISACSVVSATSYLIAALLACLIPFLLTRLCNCLLMYFLAYVFTSLLS